MWDCEQDGHVFKDSNVCTQCNGFLYAQQMPDGNFMLRMTQADELPEWQPQPPGYSERIDYANRAVYAERVPEAGGAPAGDLESQIRRVVREELANWLPVTPPDYPPER